MTDKISREVNRRAWERHIRDASLSGLGIRGYCEKNNLNIQSFYQWRKKLVGSTSVPVVSPRFARVEVVDRPRALPDPRWVAELIRHLSEHG